MTSGISIILYIRFFKFKDHHENPTKNAMFSTHFHSATVTFPRCPYALGCLSHKQHSWSAQPWGPSKNDSLNPGTKLSMTVQLLPSWMGHLLWGNLQPQHYWYVKLNNSLAGCPMYGCLSGFVGPLEWHAYSTLTQVAKTKNIIRYCQICSRKWNHLPLLPAPYTGWEHRL